MNISDSSQAEAVELNMEFHVAADHPCLAGHFPGKPLVPAVVLLDLVCSELISRLQAHPTSASAIPWRLTRIVAARFQSPWLPDESLTARVRMNMVSHRAQVTAVVAGREVASATLQLVPAARQDTLT